jgi:hypothetical protein
VKKGVCYTPMNLYLNFVPVTLVGESVISAGCQPFDDVLLKQLRKDYSQTHIFKRNFRNNTIIDVPVATGANPVANNTIELNLSKERKFLPDLLKAALVRAFYGKREIIRDYPVQVLGSADRNFISSSDLPSWVQKRSLLEFTPRNIYDTKDKPLFGLLCDARFRCLLQASCAELMALGMILEGLYVVIDRIFDDNRVQPGAQLIGRVIKVDGDNLILEDYREGYETVKATDARLPGNKVNFDWCVNNLLGHSAKQILSNSQVMTNEIHAGPGRLQIIQDTLKFLRKERMEAVPGVGFEIGELLDQSQDGFPLTEVIKKPSLVFDPSGARTDVWNERGIKSNGPYDQRTFTPKKLNIAVICQSRHEGQVDAFVAKFLEGMPDVLTGQKGNQQARFGDGFLRRYHLEKANVQNFTALSPTLKAYESACESALAKAADDSMEWDLALVQVEEIFKTLPGNLNPYFGTKALLLKNNVAVQSIRLETITQRDTNLVFTMNQMSLASYAKLGGRPWLLGAEQNVGHELVIGVGSHMASNSRLGGGSRHVGITTVFSSDGSYHLSERTNAVPFEDYTNALTDTLKRTISRVRDEDNWRNTDRVRLIVHMFKPAKDLESEALKSAVEALGLDNVTYAFLHIAPSHPFLIFDLDQEGVPPWSHDKKGIIGPSRGIHLKLNDSQSLVVFAGVSELKQASDGLPRPCLLTLHRNSTFRDMTYLARQAFDFTAHSWRIMSPERFPITIKYSALIAERLAGLKQIDYWDNDAVKFREIGRTPWFL